MRKVILTMDENKKYEIIVKIILHIENISYFCTLVTFRKETESQV